MNASTQAWLSSSSSVKRKENDRGCGEGSAGGIGGI